MKRLDNTNTIGSIKHYLRVMNLTILVGVSIIFLTVVKFTSGFLAVIPLNSALIFLGAMALLSCAMYGISRLTTHHAISAIEKFNRKLSVLLATSNEVQTIKHSDLLLEKIMDAAVALTGADGGSLFLVDDDSIEFKIVRGENAQKLLGVRLPRNKGIVGTVISSKKPLRISDAKTDVRHFGTIDDKSGYQTRSILCVPLLLGEPAIGALELVKSVPGHFSCDDEEMLQYLASQAALSLRNSHHLENMKQFEAHLTNIMIDAIDRLSGKRGHQKKVAKYALIMGRGIHLSDDEMRTLYRAALLHDIGFLKIDINDMTVTGRYKAHAEYGYDILRQITFYEDIASFVLHHHERYDGNGYPGGLTGKMIPLFSRIISIAEAFDAMTNEFSFKNNRKNRRTGGTVTLAMDELKAGAGSQFDPGLVDVFIEIITEEDVDVKGVDQCRHSFSEIAFMHDEHIEEPLHLKGTVD